MGESCSILTFERLFYSFQLKHLKNIYIPETKKSIALFLVKETVFTSSKPENLFINPITMGVGEGGVFHPLLCVFFLKNVFNFYNCEQILHFFMHLCV